MGGQHVFSAPYAGAFGPLTGHIGQMRNFKFRWGGLLLCQAREVLLDDIALAYLGACEAFDDSFAWENSMTGVLCILKKLNNK